MTGAVAVLWAVLAAACVDTSAPKDIPASISLLRLPAFFVVRGDLMRDTLGNTLTPSIIAYDGAGNPVTGFSSDFFITDSNAVAHFDNNHVLAGDRLGTFHVLGQIGNLQTPSATVYVTVAPTVLKRATPTTTGDTVRVPVTADTAGSLGSLALATTVRGAGDTAVGGVFVRYRLVSQHASKSSAPSVYLVDDANNLSTIDTADATGTASRKLVVNSLLVEQAVLTGQKKDSAIVEATAKYRGTALPGSPFRFIVPIKITFGTP